MPSQPVRRQGHRRRSRKGAVLGASAIATVIVAGGVAALASSASAASLGAVYSRTSTWDSGYTGQYVVSNTTSAAIDGWTLSFDLPAGAKISSLWNASYTASGQHVTVKPESWNKRIEPGRTVDVGFVVQGSGGAQAEPGHCLINDVSCSTGTGPAPTPSGRPTTATPKPSTSPTGSTPKPTATPTPTATKTTASPTPTSTGTPGGGRFAPYVDTSLYPAFDLVGTAKATGVKQYTLAFVVSGGGCTPKWGGVSDLTTDAVAAQIGALRAAGGDVRVSFGGANGSELATACSSAGELATAYQKAVDAYGLTKVDFDVEGGALANTAANTRRAQAIAQLQRTAAGKGKALDVSFTLPALPSGLTQDGINLVANAKDNGVQVGAVNIMAMDYGDGAAPNPQGRMGKYAIDAATATQAQIKSVLGLSDSAAWAKTAVTPMIGVNDVASEVFTVADATQLAEFAKTKHLAWLAMWSGTRDKACPGGAKAFADATCSSIDQQPLAFTRAFGAYTG
ncbi:cellulose binding domain-containing protein [Kitasatospora sp. DSM 101779]|uniref:glycoside hydrolase family 18 protein n=1 Tax=Kitasatospora sp. DSM 101779 TaxID=2853165 RepID=UPI0021D86F4B|nr:cellulose binding domain-containing protein [Kitasatospora sp. DSM 101779]MCU7824570.1 cellulose binding domain-containing protein [Kitasatospora sp. DSM 101779]